MCFLKDSKPWVFWSSPLAGRVSFLPPLFWDPFKHAGCMWQVLMAYRGARIELENDSSQEHLSWRKNLKLCYFHGFLSRIWMLTAVLVLFFFKHKWYISFKTTNPWRLKSQRLKKMSGRGLERGWKGIGSDGWALRKMARCGSCSVPLSLVPRVVYQAGVDSNVSLDAGMKLYK
jgi:hypothetical protein